MSIASAITAAQGRVAAAYDSCDLMGATMPPAADQDLSHLPATIESIPTGGGGNPEAEENDVIFIDYDGTIRYSYSKDDFAALTALPANPTHEGLTAQGWNWTLADAQAYVATYGGLIIGQMYVTDDGKTRLYIEISNPGRMTVPLHFTQTVSDGVTINWGDGSAAETATGTGNIEKTHTYASVGSYMITLSVTSGTAGLGGTSTVIGAANNNNFVYANMLRKAELGNNMVLSTNAFSGAKGLLTVTLPYGTTTANGAFQGTNIRYIVTPSGITTIANNLYYNNPALIMVSIPSGITTFGNNEFAYDYSLVKVWLPSGITTTGSSTLYNDYSIASVVIPSSVTTLGANFLYNGYGLKDLWVYPSAPPSFGSSALANIPSDCVIHVPNGKLADYQGATGWSAYSTQMVEMPA